MELKLFRHLWGVDEPWETAFPKFKAAGYAGIESGLPAPADEARFRALLASASAQLHRPDPHGRR